jgi:hypothetical protein
VDPQEEIEAAEEREQVGVDYMRLPAPGMSTAPGGDEIK